MINRRAFLQGAGALALGQGLSGCQTPEGQAQVWLLRGSIPPQLIRRFQQSAKKTGANFAFQAIPQLKDLYKGLKSEKDANSPWFKRLPWNNSHDARKSPIADLVTLGDYWLQEAIQNNLIQPISLEKIPGWQNLPLTWQQIAQRDRNGQLNRAGQIWGAPYRWGCTMIAYRRDKLKALGWTPSDWSDLWREEVRRKISIVDQPREVIGLTLKSLDKSYNSSNLSAIAELKPQLASLQQQILYYSSKYYLQPLLLGDSWLAVGWSSDILPLLKTNPDLGAVIPQSGTSLFSDCWVRPTVRSAQSPANLELPQNLRSWIEFCWQPSTAEQISRSTNGGSPILLTQPSEPFSQDADSKPLLAADPSIIQRSEFLTPLSDAVLQQYLTLWQEMRDPTAQAKSS